MPVYHPVKLKQLVLLGAEKARVRTETGRWFYVEGAATIKQAALAIENRREVEIVFRLQGERRIVERLISDCPLLNGLT